MFGRTGARLLLAIGLDLVLGYGVDHGGMRTGELAAQTGVNIETLRYYERRGLLEDPAGCP
jgi:MerR family regulatory protein